MTQKPNNDEILFQSNLKIFSSAAAETFGWDLWGCRDCGREQMTLMLNHLSYADWMCWFNMSRRRLLKEDERPQSSGGGQLATSEHIFTGRFSLSEE